MHGSTGRKSVDLLRETLGVQKVPDRVESIPPSRRRASSSCRSRSLCSTSSSCWQLLDLEGGREHEDKPRVCFELGQVVITANAARQLYPDSYREGLERHARGDWGEASEEDCKANDRALEEGTRVLSAYRDSQGKKYWIITEADRSATTILLPEDY